jgi:Transcriptional regulators
MNIDNLIKNKYDTLTKSEKKIAQYIMNNEKEVIYGTMETIKKTSMWVMPPSYVFRKN